MWIRATLYPVVAYFLLVNAAFSQTTPTPQPSSKAAATADGTIKVVFSGKTLNDYIAVIKSQDANANIVIEGNAGAVKVPQVSFTKISVPLALRWIQETAEARNQHLVLRTCRVAGESGAVYVFSIVPADDSRASTPDIVVKTYAVPPADGSGFTPDLLRAGVENAIKKLPGSEGTVEYSSQTKLLTIKGSRADIGVADRTFEEMTRSQRVAAALPRMQAEIDRLKSDVADIKKQRP